MIHKGKKSGYAYQLIVFIWDQIIFCLFPQIYSNSDTHYEIKKLASKVSVILAPCFTNFGRDFLSKTYQIEVKTIQVV